MGDGGPTSDAMDLDVEKFPGGEQPERRKKAVWRESVGQVLSSYMAGADIGWESEGLETFVARIARLVANAFNSPGSVLRPFVLDRALSVDPSGRTLNTLKALGFVGCAREGTLSHSTPSPLCVVCDNRLDTVSAATPPSLIAAVRIFTKTPLDGMQMSASALLDNKTDIRVRLGFLQATTRLLHHSRSDKAALDLSKDKFAELVVQQLGGTVRSIRVAAGYALQAYRPFSHLADRSSAAQLFSQSSPPIKIVDRQSNTSLRSARFSIDSSVTRARLSWKLLLD